MDIQIAGTFIAVIAAILGVLVSFVAKRLYSVKVGGIEVSFDRDFKPTANLEKDSRLIEARELLRKQEACSTWNARANGSLTFGQYVVGGVLATSFVQETLSNQTIGLLGVLVLISSLIHQTYRPDLQSRGARERVTRLRRLIRRAEDDLFTISSEIESAPSIQQVREFVSRGLSDVEELELEVIEANNAKNSA